MELLKPKTKIRVGSWNVRTYYQAGTLQQVLQEMEDCNIELLCVIEARWIDSGKRNLSTGHTILYSGQADHQHRGGVAIIVTRNMEKSLLDWKPISDRLIKVSFNSKLAKLSVTVMHQRKMQRRRSRMSSMNTWRKKLGPHPGITHGDGRP